MLDWNRNQMYAAALIGEVLFWGLFFVFGFQGWVPVFPLLATALAFLNVVILFAGYFVSKDESMPGFETTTKQQVSEEKAYNLARYLLAYRHGYRVERVTDRGIDPAVSPSDDKEDAVRLFKLEFEPLNLSGKATLYIDLEQELSLNEDDLESFDKAARKIQNIRIVKSWTSEDYQEKVEDVKESLGRSVDPTITRITETDSGREIEKMPAGVQNQRPSNTESSDSES